MKKLLLFFHTILFLHPSIAQKKDHDSPDFFLSTSKKKVAVILKASDFKVGEQVADIGTGNGWFAAALSIHTDSLLYTLEDIDSMMPEASRFQEALRAAEKIKERPVTNAYRWIIGTEKSTTLPPASFDKVLLIDTYHHLSHRDEMLRDLFSILKPGGKLVVMEPIARKTGDTYKGCNSVVYKMEEIINTFLKHGFVHERTLKTVKSTRQRVRVFVFGKR